MAICSKCKTGFDSDLGRCPKCNSVYDSGKKRVNFSFINFSFFFFLGVWLLAVGLPLLAISIPQFIGNILLLVLSFALSILEFSSISLAIFSAVFLASYFGIALWVCSDAQRRGKAGILVALLVLITPVLGLILWLIFRPPVNS